MDDIYAIYLMAEYLHGPGFAGWLAWIDQEAKQTSTECRDCGQAHQLPAVDADTVRANLERFMNPARVK